TALALETSAPERNITASEGPGVFPIVERRIFVPAFTPAVAAHHHRLSRDRRITCVAFRRARQASCAVHPQRARGIRSHVRAWGGRRSLDRDGRQRRDGDCLRTRRAR